MFAYLVENIKLNGARNVTAYNKAVYRESGRRLKFKLSEVGGHSSLVGFVTNDRLAGVVEVESISIDDFVSSVKVKGKLFIKIDVEGAEYYVLEGSLSTLESYDLYLLVEIHNKLNYYKIIELFDSLKYKYKIININDKINYNVYLFAWKHIEG